MARSQGVRVLREQHFREGLEVKLDDEGRLQVKVRPMFARELRKVLREISVTARTIVRSEHGKTGRLERSIHPTVVRQVGPHRIAGSVSAGSRLAPYARYVHEGTRAHVIRARKPGGRLSFTANVGRNGKKTFTREVKRLLPREMLSAGGRQDRARRERMGMDRTRLRYSDRDVYTEDVTQAYAEREVVVSEVNHPGYRGHRFLNQAAAMVVGGRYGGRVNLPKRGVTRT